MAECLGYDDLHIVRLSVTVTKSVSWYGKGNGQRTLPSNVTDTGIIAITI